MTPEQIRQLQYQRLNDAWSYAPQDVDGLEGSLLQMEYNMREGLPQREIAIKDRQRGINDRMSPDFSAVDWLTSSDPYAAALDDFNMDRYPEGTPGATLQSGVNAVADYASGMLSGQNRLDSDRDGYLQDKQYLDASPERQQAMTRQNLEDLATQAMDSIGGLGAVSKVVRKAANQKPRNLAVIHNLTDKNLMFADEFGGLPVPSLAVVHKDRPLNSFGDITLVGDKDMATPSAKNPFFRTDAYSPRFPETTNFYNDKKMTKFTDTMFDDFPYTGQSPYNISNNMENPKHALDDLLRNPTLARRYLREQGQDVAPVMTEPDTSILDTFPQFKGRTFDTFNGRDDPELVSAYRERVKQSRMLRGATEQEADKFAADASTTGFNFTNFIESINSASDGPEVDTISSSDKYRKMVTAEEGQGFDPDYAKWVTDQYDALQPKAKFFAGYTPDGDSRYRAMTPHNVVGAMKGNINNEEGMHYGLGSYRASITPRIRSMKAMKDMEGSLVSKEDMDVVKGQLDREFDNIHSALEKYEKHKGGGISQSDTMDRLAGIRKGTDTWEDYYTGVPDSLKQDVRKFEDDLVSSPSEYFEGKPQRMVDLSEFKGALVPDNVPPEILDILKRHNIADVHKYADDADKAEKLKKFQDLLFTTPALGALGYGLMTAFGADEQDTEQL